MANPTTITQYAEGGAEHLHISWRDEQFSCLINPSGRSIETAGTLIHIARAPDADIRNKTYFLQATGYQFMDIPDQINGISVNLHSQRRGRVTDDTIQLCLGGKLIGQNRADRTIDTTKIYGGSGDLWGAKLTAADIMDPSFGVVVRLQSHPEWPHKDVAFIGALAITIY